MTTQDEWTLCRLTRTETEYLMMAPAVAGGWIDTHADSREAVGAVCGVAAADFLAYLPARWREATRRPVSTAEAHAILAQLRRRAQQSVVGEEHIAAAAARRLCALLTSEHA